MRLSNSRHFRRIDNKSGTIAFFATDELQIATLDQSMIDELMQISCDNGQANIRICLHTSPEDIYHDMIILEWQGHYFPPHRHPKKAETQHIMSGAARVCHFDDRGLVISSETLGHANRIMRIAAGLWHFATPATPCVIYHESKPGPFLGDRDREFAPWAPAIGEDAREFLERIR